MLIQSRTTHQGGLKVQIQFEIVVDLSQHLLGFGNNFRANAVTRQQQNITGHIFYSLFD